MALALGMPRMTCSDEFPRTVFTPSPESARGVAALAASAVALAADAARLLRWRAGAPSADAACALAAALVRWTAELPAQAAGGARTPGACVPGQRMSNSRRVSTSAACTLRVLSARREHHKAICR